MASSNQLDATTVALLALLAVIVLPFLLMVLGFGTMMGYGGMMGGTVGWWPLVGMVVPLVVILVTVAGGSLLVKRSFDDGTARDPALEELRAAYARGELTDEEFETRLERLDGSE